MKVNVYKLTSLDFKEQSHNFNPCESAKAIPSNMASFLPFRSKTKLYAGAKNMKPKSTR